MNIPLTPDGPLVLRSPGDLLIEVPALLGFTPAESLVVVLTRGSDLRCTLRWDLTADWVEMAIRSLGIAQRADADGALLLVYTTNSGDAPPYAAQVEAFIGLLDEQDLQVRDALLVDRGRWWSYCCEDPACCPPEGSPVPVRVSVLDAERALRGRPTAQPSRTAVAAAFQPDPDRELPRQALGEAQTHLDRHRGLARAQYALAALTTLVREAEEARPGDRDAHPGLQNELHATVALAVQDVHTRDYLLGHAMAAWTDLAVPAAVLAQTALAAPPTLRPAVAATAMAVMAAEGTSSVGFWALSDMAAGASLAELLRSGMEAGLPPDDVRDVLLSALPDVEALLRADTAESRTA